MTNEEYKKISSALDDLKENLINSIEKHTKETIEIINNQDIKEYE